MKTIKFTAVLLVAVFIIGMLPFVSAEKQDHGKTLVESLKEKVEQAKENYEKNKETYKQNIEEFKNKTKEARAEFRQVVLTNAADRLVAHIDVLTSVLDKTRARFDNMNITDETILTKIDSAKSELNDIKSEVQEKKENITKEELKQYIVDVKTVWQETKLVFSLAIVSARDNQLGSLFVKLEALEDKFNKIKERLVANGADTTKLDKYIADFDQKVADAKKEYENAQNLFNQAKEESDQTKQIELIKQAHELQRKAFEIVKDLRKDLRDVVGQIKEDSKHVKKVKENKTEDGLNESEAKE